ncbi:MAG: TOBE domain-containing protein, partial [Lachnospiraceae bacterium]
VVLRPEDIDIVEPEKSKLKGTVASIVFKGVHYEIIVRTARRDYKIHTTDYHEVGKDVGLSFTDEDIHVMYKMEN